MLKKIFVVFKVVVILNLLICLIMREWAATFICLFNFILFLLVDFFQNKIKYGDFFKLLIYVFLFLSLIGGEVYLLYIKFKYFDTFLHTFSSFIVSGLFYYICIFLKNKFNKYLFIVCIFSFAIMIAALWELTEFSIDRILNVDTQKDTVINEINSYYLSDDGKEIGNVKISNMVVGDYSFNGYLDIGLYDTIDDMFCAVIGSILFIIWGKLKEAF